MKVLIETVAHEDQRYPTVGDYQELADGTLHITISRLGDEKSEVLVALHEFVEAFLTKWAGIKEEDITNFDVEFEKNRKEGNTDEPGFDSAAPYKREHTIATGIELIMAAAAGVDWKQHEEKINQLL